MDLHGLFPDTERAGDLLVEHAGHDKGEHLALARVSSFARCRNLDAGLGREIARVLGQRPAAANVFWRSSPMAPGIWMSRTRQQGPVDGGMRQNSRRRSRLR
jgi:hypothetical protein